MRGELLALRLIFVIFSDEFVGFPSTSACGEKMYSSRINAIFIRTSLRLSGRI